MKSVTSNRVSESLREITSRRSRVAIGDYLCFAMIGSKSTALRKQRKEKKAEQTRDDKIGPIIGTRVHPGGRARDRSGKRFNFVNFRSVAVFGKYRRHYTGRYWKAPRDSKVI